MFIRRLSLTDFRNHRDTVIAIGHRMVAISGDNGAGKTNILEAVSMLSPGRGMRGSAIADIARQDGTGGFGVAARLSGTLGAEPDLTLGTAVEPSQPTRRKVSINGSPAPAVSLGEWLAILWLTPAMDRLFTDGPGGRRRFLDRLTLALRPDHAMHASRYEAATRARNRLLAEGRPDDEWITALEQAMATHGAAIDGARRDVLDALKDAFADIDETPFAKPVLSLSSESEKGVGWEEGQLKVRLARTRHRDARAARTLSGPHRDDLAVVHAATGQIAARCSTGEQKALLLSIVLAHGDAIAQRRGQRPILLLDEVAAHLDPVRRAALFDRLDATGGQVWMTGTETALFDSLPGDATRLNVRAGSIAPGN